MDRILDTRRLHAFEAVARLGSFTAAARELCLTQSAVSHAIRSLEDSLGCRLFLRRGRSIELTAEGRRLRERTVEILGRMEEVLEELRPDGPGGLAGRPVRAEEAGSP